MKQKSNYFIKRGGFCAIAAIVCLILAIVFRIIGGIRYLSVTNDLIFEMILPAAACFLFILCIVCFGEKGFWTSFIPVCIGATYFILHVALNGGSEALPLSEAFLPIYTSVCILIFVFGSSLYSATVTGGVRTKWIMVAFLVLCLSYQGAFRVYPAVQKGLELDSIMMLLSVICMLLGLTFTTLGLKKLHIAKPSQDMPAVPPIPGAVPQNTPALTAQETVTEQKPEEPEVIPQVLNEVKPELEPVQVQSEKPEPAPESELENTETENAEPERTPAEVPVSFGEKLRRFFNRKVPEEEPKIEAHPDLGNVMDAIDSNISDSGDVEAAPEEAAEPETDAVEPASEPISEEPAQEAKEDSDAF